MVEMKSKKMVVKTKSRKEYEYDTEVVDFRESPIEGTKVMVSAAVARFNLKSEDRFQVKRASDDKEMNSCTSALNTEPRLEGFFGVFDGHNGDAAAEYCAQGLASHIVAEQACRSVQAVQRWSFGLDRANAPLDLNTQSARAHTEPLPRRGVGLGISFGNDQANQPLNTDMTSTTNSDSTGSSHDNNGDVNNASNKCKHKHHPSELDIPVVAAFQKAQQRFGNRMDAPTFPEVMKNNGAPLRLTPPMSVNPMTWKLPGQDGPRLSGTTACTMCIFSQKAGDGKRKVLPCVVVANTGDSRLITDDGKATKEFRQVTTEHRPEEPSEKKRLTECVARGEAVLHRSAEHRDIRVFPGGLAVSRTIGDCDCSKSVIPTPEIIHLPLNISTKKGKEKCQRFVMGSDGLWDFLETEDVGAVAAQKLKQGRISTKQAAMKILQKCLEAGGDRDDVTVVVVDVKYAGAES